MKRKNWMKWHVDNDVSYKEVAEEMGYTVNHYSLLINGKGDPSFGFIEEFCAYAEKHGYEIGDVWEFFKKF